MIAKYWQQDKQKVLGSGHFSKVNIIL
jgi:hypothetical protein